MVELFGILQQRVIFAGPHLFDDIEHFRIHLLIDAGLAAFQIGGKRLDIFTINLI